MRATTWCLEGGSWSETLTVSGDSTHHYLTDEQGHVVDQRAKWHNGLQAGVLDQSPELTEALLAEKDKVRPGWRP